MAKRDKVGLDAHTNGEYSRVSWRQNTTSGSELNEDSTLPPPVEDGKFCRDFDQGIRQIRSPQNFSPNRVERESLVLVKKKRGGIFSTRKTRLEFTVIRRAMSFLLRVCSTINRRPPTYFALSLLLGHPRNH